MGNILSQIRTKRLPTDDAAVQSMLQDLRSKAMSEAMAEAKVKVTASLRGEMDRLRGQLQEARDEVSVEKQNTSLVKGERDTAQTLLKRAEGTVETLTKKVSSLTAMVKLEQGVLHSKTIELNAQITDIRIELAQAKAASDLVGKENARLLARKEAKPAVLNNPVREKIKIPDFVISNPVRGPDNRIVSATIKPVGTN